MQDQPLSNPARISAKGLKVPPRAADKPVVVKSQSTATTTRKSAAGLTVPQRKTAAKLAPPKCEVPHNGAERRALFNSLRKLRDEIKPTSKQPEVAITLIKACIIGGICTKPTIVSALVHLGLDNRFAGVMIDTGAKGRQWQKGAEGRYYLLD